VMDLPVLVTPPGSELQLPAELGFPEGSTWRLAECQGQCFLVALASAATFSSPALRRLTMCWDSDLAEFLESPMMRLRLHALQHVKSQVFNGKPSLQAREIVEIWRGVDTAADDIEGIVFKVMTGLVARIGG